MMDAEVEAPSPFLPGTKIQYALDSTSLGYFKTCPRLYFYKMIERWQSKEQSIHLKFGGMFHEALHQYDILRLDDHDHEETVFQVVRWLCNVRGEYPDVSEEKPSIKAKSFEALLRTVIWYLDDYPTESDPAKTLVLENGKPACELSFKFELDWGPPGQADSSEKMGNPFQPYLLCGHLDRVVTFQDNLFVMDRKTTTWALTGKWFDQFQPNNQMSLYSIAGKVVLNMEIKGVIIDAALIKNETKEKAAHTEFARGFTYRTPAQSEEWLDDLRMWTSAMETCATMEHWPQNDTACDKFGGCEFREVCSKNPSVRKAFLKAGFSRGPQWNPLVSR